MPYTVDPLRMFEIKGDVSQLQCAIGANPIAVANNTQLVAFVAGKRIRVMGYVAQSSGAGISQFQLKSASGGTSILSWVTQNGSASSPLYLPITESGYAETNTGEGLFIDVTTTTLYLSLFYIIYTP